MGVEATNRKSTLPAPTDSPTEHTGGDSGTEAEIATDLSRRSDKTSWTIPEDGREITIPAKRRKDKRDESKLSKTSASQTSLLIEYFEGGKVQARPSVRVKVTPSAARKIRSQNEHITVSETGGGRKPSFTKRISLAPRSSRERQNVDSADDKSISSYTSAAEESSLAHRKAPLEIEVMGHDGSDLSRGSDDRMLLQNQSEISSMPPDSMLEEKQSRTQSATLPKHRSPSTEYIAAKDSLQTPQRTRSRSISKERLAHKAMEKITAKSREGSSGKHRRSSRTSRSRSASTERVDTLSTPVRKTKKTDHENASRVERGSSLVSDSQASSNRHSGDSYSFRSGASRSSLNTNPKLLDAVENAIKKFVMPELEMIKQEARVQRARSRFESDEPDDMLTEKSHNRLSKHNSAPDVGKPKVVLNRNDNDPGTTLSGDSIKGRKDRRRSRKSDSPQERRSEREMSEETVIHDPQRGSKRKGSKEHRLQVSSGSGSLTRDALKHHDIRHSDSRSTVGSKERRRRRRSKSHSRSASLAESEDAFKKHEVPPMPLQSDIHSSDITRDSILSIDTDFEVKKAQTGQIARASPREISSPGTRTPTRARNNNIQKNLSAHLGNPSPGQVTQGSPLNDRSLASEGKGSLFGGDKNFAARSEKLGLREYADRNSYDENDGLDERALSPIQSVSSKQESDLNRSSFVEDRRRSAPSIKSATSNASAAKFDHSHRPKGVNFESRAEVMDPYKAREIEDSGDDESADEWLQKGHEQNEEYRSSIDDPTVDYRHMTNYTDDSNDQPYLESLVEREEKHDVDARKNPDYRSTPNAVESAVASLLDTSVVSTRSKGGDRSYMDMPAKDAPRDVGLVASREPESGEAVISKKGLSPQRSYLHDSSAKNSPRQSIAHSATSEPPQMGTSGVPLADDPMPDMEGLRSDSDISTNPSFLHGPMAGTPTGNRDHWPYKPTPPQKLDQYGPDSRRSSDSVNAKAAGILAAAQLANKSVSPDKNQPRSREWSTKDGYGAPLDNLDNDGGSFADLEDFPRSEKSIPNSDLDGPVAKFGGAQTPSLDGEQDPFTGNGHARHLSTNSGLARGVGSPLYDSATGNGMDRIQSKDIVALMDHLTVRDAHRNARDTEILVTLVRSAAEMRNSFEEMKKFIAEQDDILVEAGNKQHDRTIQRMNLGGPRPPPPNFTRRSSAEDGTDTPTKKRHMFRRALRGLSGRNQNDISRVEDMLEHLLDEVASLKAAPEGNLPSSRPQSRSKSLDSYHQMRASDPEEYAAQTTAGSPSANRAPFFSSPSGRGPSAVQPMLDRQASDRVSTVLEADEELEELDEHEQHVLSNQFENNERMLNTPTKDRPFLPPDDLLATPPQHRLAAAAASANANLTKSIDDTPKSSTEKSRKHKSNSSSIFPKVSRWSRTTASSFGDNFRTSGARGKERPLSDASQLEELPQFEADHYDPQGADRLPINDDSPEHPGASFAQRADEDRPPSPLVPSTVSQDLDAKYHSHRDSMDLQHPQPRPGPTQRFQRQLESQAQQYNRMSGGSARGSPGFSPTSDTFGSDPTLSRFMPAAAGRFSQYGGHLSPISDNASLKSASEQAPPRPPKVRESSAGSKDGGPLVPSNVDGEYAPVRPPKEKQARFSSSSSKEHLNVPGDGNDISEEKRWSGVSASEEARNRRVTPTRKPTGPRPIVSSGTYSPANRGDKDVVVQKTRYRGSPNALPSEESLSEGQGAEGNGTF